MNIDMEERRKVDAQTPLVCQEEDDEVEAFQTLILTMDLRKFGITAERRQHTILV